MGWSIPSFSRAEINSASRVLTDHALRSSISPPDSMRAFDIVNNWRSSHAFPLNTIQIGLRRSAGLIDSNYLVAQRIKRLSSITHKLQRFPGMKLSQMQDLGGCRAIMRSLHDVSRLGEMYKEGVGKHKKGPVDDYILNPKPSGYRGLHFIYRYFSDRNTIYNDLKIEIQIRSSLQHAWATAVETVGTFTNQALKSSMGKDDWLRFFILMGSAIADIEGTPLVPGTPIKKSELVKELRSLNKSLQITEKLMSYGNALNKMSDGLSKNAHYFILRLDTKRNSVTILGYPSKFLHLAEEKYSSIEKEIIDDDTVDAVLVSVDSVTSLQRAYPNYFLDTKVFLEFVNDYIK
jgi:hypothetical protein